jgi:hypothetical protein
METVDDETSNAAMGFIDKQVKAGTTFLRLDQLDQNAGLYPHTA